MKNIKPLLVSGIACAAAATAATVGLAAPASAAPLYSKGFQVYNYVPTGLGYSVTLTSYRRRHELRGSANASQESGNG